MATNKKKISPMHIFRRLSQITFFIFLPGIFTSSFYAIKEVYQAVLGGTASLNTISGSLLILFGTVVLTVFFGRFFCGFACSFGAIGDLLWFLSKKTIKPKFRPSETLDAGLKYIKYGILIFIFFGLWTFQLVTIDSMSSPWTIFGMFSSVTKLPSAKYLFTIGGLLLLLIMIGSLLIERFFCRYLCPLGAVFAIVSKVRFFHVDKKRDKCGSCRMCTKSCSMGIPLYKYDKVTSGECINCFACVENCPRSNVKANPAPAVASAVSVVAISGLVYAGTVVSTNASQNGVGGNGTATESMAKGIYTDGTYTGTGMGFRGQTKVTVTVENGNITDVTTVSYEDDPEYFGRAEKTIISEIISGQSADVDSVSGATFSSRGIIQAVSAALEGKTAASNTENTANTSETQNGATVADKSQNSDTQTAESNAGSSDSSQTQTTESANSSSAQTQQFKDGTYTGTGTGFRGDTNVSVTVANGKISDITVVSYQDDAQFFSRAKNTVISEILKNQDVNVDAVSGATYSSNGIIDAVANALNIKNTNTNSNTNTNDSGFTKKGRTEHNRKDF